MQVTHIPGFMLVSMICVVRVVISANDPTFSREETSRAYFWELQHIVTYLWLRFIPFSYISVLYLFCLPFFLFFLSNYSQVFTNFLELLRLSKNHHKLAESVIKSKVFLQKAYYFYLALVLNFSKLIPRVHSYLSFNNQTKWLKISPEAEKFSCSCTFLRITSSPILSNFLKYNTFVTSLLNSILASVRVTTVEDNDCVIVLL